MTWRKKNDWEGYKDFLLNTDIGSEFYTRWDYKTRTNVGPENAPRLIREQVNKLERGTEIVYDEVGNVIVYRDTDGNIILNKAGNQIPKKGIPDDTIKVARMNTWIKSQMHAPTKKFRKHMFKYLYIERFKKNESRGKMLFLSFEYR